MQRAIIIIVALVTFLIAGPAVFAQCALQRITGPQQGFPGIHEDVHATLSWDPDGPGPLDPILIVGGYIFHAGTRNISHIAAWDGHDWLPLGSGTDGQVRALANYNGE